MVRVLTNGNTVVVEQIGDAVARLINDKCRHLNLKVWQFGGVSLFWSNADEWFNFVPALLVMPIQSEPRTQGVNQRLIECDDTFRLIYCFALSKDGGDPKRKQAQDLRSIVYAMSQDTHLSEVQQDLFRDEQVNITGSVIDAIEYEPPENVELSAAAQPLMAGVIRWRVRWQSLRT